MLFNSCVAVQTVRREYAARLIQDIWRGLVLQRRKIIELFQGSRGRVLKVTLQGWNKHSCIKMHVYMLDKM